MGLWDGLKSLSAICVTTVAVPHWLGYMIGVEAVTVMAHRFEDMASITSWYMDS